MAPAKAKVKIASQCIEGLLTWDFRNTEVHPLAATELGLGARISTILNGVTYNWGFVNNQHL